VEVDLVTANLGDVKRVVLLPQTGADWGKPSVSDIESVERIEASLAVLEPAEIEEFQRLLRLFLDLTYHWDLWAVAYAARGGCGDDEFEYFRAWLILQGKDVYEAAVTDPLRWATGPTFEGASQCEELLYAAPNAYLSKVGREMPQSNFRHF